MGARRWFISLPAFRTVEDVEAHCNRIGAGPVGGYRGFDGLRCLVELPESAMDRLAGEAAGLERRARELLAQAQGKTGAPGQ